MSSHVNNAPAVLQGGSGVAADVSFCCGKSGRCTVRVVSVAQRCAARRGGWFNEEPRNRGAAQLAVTERTLLQMLTRESILVSSERGSLVVKQRKMGVSELADAAASSHRV